MLQQQPVQVDNYRPYMEQFKRGAVGYDQITGQDLDPIYRR